MKHNKIYAFIQMYNEESSGNLKRCLENCKEWADDIIIYDDKSTDNSVNLAKEYTSNILLGEKNEWSKETYHKEELLQYIHNMDLKPDWILWIDCDEILDKKGCEEIKNFCQENYDKNIDAYAFQQINLWRGDKYFRKDKYFYKENYDGSYGWFVRLWKYKPELKMLQEIGADRRLFPINIININPAPFKIIHYGFSNYKNVLKHIGIHNNTKEQLIKCASGKVYEELVENGVEWAKTYVVNGKGIPNMFIDETTLEVGEVLDEWIPDKNKTNIFYPKPEPFGWEELKTYDEL